MSANHRLGQLGEELAGLYLQMRGLRLLHRRYRVPGGEIDLVLTEGRTVVFVEVKTRGSRRAPRPELRVAARQLAFLRRAALRWLRDHGRRDQSCRFDVVTVDLGQEEGELRLRHFRGVCQGSDPFVPSC